MGNLASLMELELVAHDPVSFSGGGGGGGEAEAAAEGAAAAVPLVVVVVAAAAASGAGDRVFSVGRPRGAAGGASAFFLRPGSLKSSRPRK